MSWTWWQWRHRQIWLWSAWASPAERSVPPPRMPSRTDVFSSLSRYSSAVWTTSVNAPMQWFLIVRWCGIVLISPCQCDRNPLRWFVPMMLHSQDMAAKMLWCYRWSFVWSAAAACGLLRLAELITMVVPVVVGTLRSYCRGVCEIGKNIFDISYIFPINAII